MTTETDSVRIDLAAELTVARNEIKNLRKQIAALNQVHRKDVQHIFDTLENFRSANYSPSDSKPGTKQAIASANRTATLPHPILNGTDNASVTDASSSTTFQPIGIIRTQFPGKRAVPRQPSVASQLTGCVELNAAAFTNPAHALDGLSDFSHMWIIYHFHRNSGATKAKVAPPRLNGQRVGVFSTRSPHRPCPIGLSLVEVQRVDGARVYFRGTDMVDGTPVLDIKPYIPLYDCAASHGDGNAMQSQQRGKPAILNLPQLSSREEPDGEESDGAAVSASGAGSPASPTTDAIVVGGGVPMAFPAATKVRVPDWILAAPTLEVLFNERAEAELSELNVDRSSIVDVMSADPRSVYIRTKYGSQIFTFQLGDVAVTCKFDDPAESVTVVRIRRNDNLPV